MNLVLMGKGGSGKSSIQKYLCENFRYDKIVTVTTRAPRDGEVDGVDYHFVSKPEYIKMIKDKEIICPANFNKEYYGIKLEDVSEDVDNKVIILEPIGAYELFWNSEIDAMCFYIDSSDTIRTVRRIRRGDSDASIIDRDIADEIAFSKIQGELEFESVFSVTNDSSNVEDVVHSILEIVASRG